MNKEEVTKKCNNCGKDKESTKQRKVKENGVVGYYDIDVVWCDKCVERHNRYLVESWG